MPDTAGSTDITVTAFDRKNKGVTEMPYETKSRWTIDELKKLNRAALFKLHKPYVAFIVVLEVIFAAGFVLSVLIRSTSLMIEFIALFIILPLAVKLATNYKINKSFKTNKILQDTVTTYRFSEDRVETSSERGTAFIRYDELYRILETDTNFYLFISKDQALNIIKAECSPELIAFLQEKRRENGK